MRASRTQYLQTRFETHVDLGLIFFDKARLHPIPYAWMARMQFDKAVKASPQRADEIAQFYHLHGNFDRAAAYYQKRLKDPSCHHDPAAWQQLGGALQIQAEHLKPGSKRMAGLLSKAQAARDKAAVLAQPAPRPPSALPPVPTEITTGPAPSSDN